MEKDITDYGQTPSTEPLEHSEIRRYIPHDYILRVLLEQGIHELRAIQKEAIQKGLFFRESFLVCAPSGSGKTLIGELASVNNVYQGFGKSVYLVPFKALASEKYWHFKKAYGRKNEHHLKIALSMGDVDVSDDKLKEADIIVTTYEKMDSILRNFHDKEWIHDISTIVIDEIHIVGDSGRGPRLESLIVRLCEFLPSIQLIGLSATINNPQFFNDWLTLLGKHAVLIESHDRPVPLHYDIRITQNKDSTMKNIIKKTIESGGQVLVFVYTKKQTQQTALMLRKLIANQLKPEEKKACLELHKTLSSIQGGNKDLQKTIKHGVCFHHAGLLPKERHLVESNYKKHLIKVICCTTTLAAGINLPARTVILKDFKRKTEPGFRISNFKGYHDSGDGVTFFKPYTSNEVFQILGRAGRPGLDNVGYGILLVKTIEERYWLEDHYFKQFSAGKEAIPNYEDLQSGLNSVNTLKEQVLLRVYEEKSITMEQLKRFFEKTYFWHCLKDRIKVPIEQLLMIKEISPLNILKLHSNPETVRKLISSRHDVSITNFDNFKISGLIKTDYGVHACEFNVDAGIRCSCGFDNGITDNFVSDEFAFEFCDHVTVFLIHLLKNHDANFQKYVRDIIPKSIKNQYILNYLFEKGLIYKHDTTGEVKCSHFGKLIIRLYLYPTSGVLIRDKLQDLELEDFQSIIKEAFEILKAEGRIRDFKLLDPVLDWCEEIHLDTICERYNIMAGDLYSVRDNLERRIMFIGIIARHLRDEGIDEDKLIRIAEMCETLTMRIKHGIKEELFDLVHRLPMIGRVRGRILHDAGYHTATKVRKASPHVLNQKTGLGLNFCKKIIEKK